MPDRMIGPFEVEKEVGVGGMGIVYLATYTKNQKRVALKLLTESVANKPKLLARFERECDILKKLNHPNIVRYYGGGCVKGKHFYAMEYMDAGSLERRMKRKGTLTWQQAVEVAKQVCAGLDHAHRHSVIHRDLKPGNLFLTKRGRLKLGDFGIAKDEDESGLTSQGKTVGTYAYMAPEQIVGKPKVSGATDLYALGIVLYEIMSGKCPFDADVAVDILFQHLEKEPPSIRVLVPDCPKWLDRTILRLLEKKPEDRFESARALYESLKASVAAYSGDANDNDEDQEPAFAAAAVESTMHDDTSTSAFESRSATRSPTASGSRSRSGDQSGSGADTAIEASGERFDDEEPDDDTVLDRPRERVADETSSDEESDTGVVFRTAEISPQQAAALRSVASEEREIVTKDDGGFHTEVIDIDRIMSRRMLESDAGSSQPIYRKAWFLATCAVVVVCAAAAGVIVFWPS